VSSPVRASGGTVSKPWLTETFDRIKEKHPYASWAIWSPWWPPDGRPKSNMGDLTVLDPDRNPALLGMLRSDVVMLGLNLWALIQRNGEWRYLEFLLVTS
jgi:hypothetical protein